MSPVLDSRQERSNASAIALGKLLQRVCNEPSTHSETPSLFAALKSQGALAKLQIESMGIRAASLNTLKRAADQAHPGGFPALDNLRRRCVDAIQKLSHVPKNRPDSKLNLIEKNQDLERKNLSLHEDLMFLSECLGSAMEQARRYAKQADRTTMEMCKKEQREILASLGLRPSVGDINGPMNGNR